MDKVTRLEDWFGERLQGMEASDPVRAYVTAVFSSMKSAQDDMSRDSVVLAYSSARDKGDFAGFQRVGDWTLWVMTFAPESVCEKQLVVDLGRLSYYSCWRLMRKEWEVYEELADDLPDIFRRARRSLRLGPGARPL